MSEQITVTYDPSTVDSLVVLNRLQARHVGAWGRLQVLSITVAAYVAVYLIAKFGFGVNITAAVWLSALFAFEAAFFALLFAQTLVRRRFKRDMTLATYKPPQVIFQLDRSGVRGSATNATWDQVQSVERIKSVTALKLTPQLYVLLPDAGLPDGLTPDALLEQIKTWRS